MSHDRALARAMLGRGVLAGTGTVLLAVGSIDEWPFWVAGGIAMALGWALMSAALSAHIGVTKTTLANVGTGLALALALVAAGTGV